jgi:hypothetical protein
MDFFEDLKKNVGAILNPVQAGLNQFGAASPLFPGANLPGMGGNPLDSHFQATMAPIVDPVTGQQISGSIGASQNAIAGQQNLANQLVNPNVGNQQQDLNGILRQQMAGQGPNPAQAALAQQTGNNISQQAALMAGQRGAGANAGLIARQAGQQGAGIQQQAVGQAATLQAQQQIAAQQQLQQALQSQAQQGLAAQGAVTTAAQNQQGQLLGAQGQYNSSQVSNYGNANTANAGVAAGNAQRNGQVIGGALNGISAALPVLAALNQGGMVDHMSHASACYYDGGQVPAMVSPGEKYIPPNQAKEVASGKKSVNQVGEKIPGKAAVKGDSLKNDTVKKNLEEGGVVIPRSVMDDPKKAKQFLVEALAKHGKNEETDFHEALKKAVAKRKAS